MKPFTTLAILLFALMALAHLYRLLRPFEVVVARHGAAFMGQHRGVAGHRRPGADAVAGSAALARITP